MLKAAAVVAMLFLVSCERHPSDQEMIDFFREHRSEFIELRDIAAADYSPDMTRIEREDLDIDWENNPPEILISSDLSSMAEGRKQSYRILMDQLKVKQLQMWPRGVEFLVSSRGLAVSGSAKMYVWTDEPPFGPVVERVEDPLPKEGFVTENWFNGYPSLRKSGTCTTQRSRNTHESQIGGNASRRIRCRHRARTSPRRSWQNQSGFGYALDEFGRAPRERLNVSPQAKARAGLLDIPESVRKLRLPKVHQDVDVAFVVELPVAAEP